jgi:hypothetical protein
LGHKIAARRGNGSPLQQRLHIKASFDGGKSPNFWASAGDVARRVAIGADQLGSFCLDLS